MKDIFTKSWIIEKSKIVVSQYSEGITIRQLYYRLVAEYGLTNDINHYKRVVNAMTKARWNWEIPMESFIDRERSMYGRTQNEDKHLENEIERGKLNIRAWMNHYTLEKWSNQENYIEVWIEKKALQGVFETPCFLKNVGLFPCKGYPSITALHEASKRFNEAINKGQKTTILYFGDYDPSGSDIPRSIEQNLNELAIPIEINRIALNKDLIEHHNLPGVPPKRTDTRTSSWEGTEAVELDALKPNILTNLCENAIEHYFNEKLYDELLEKQTEEKIKYKKELKEFIGEL